MCYDSVEGCRSTMTHIAPSHTTLTAVSGASNNMPNDRQTACISGVKLSMLANTGMIATTPPGIAGAATQVNDRTTIKGINDSNSIGCPTIIMIVSALITK